MTKLNEAELQQAMAHLPGWTTDGSAIERNFKFADFVAAMAFVNRIAELAEQANHHPDIDIRYNRVTLALISHDAGGITARDARMARHLNTEFPATPAPNDRVA